VDFFVFFFSFPSVEPCCSGVYPFLLSLFLHSIFPGLILLCDRPCYFLLFFVFVARNYVTGPDLFALSPPLEEAMLKESRNLSGSPQVFFVFSSTQVFSSIGCYQVYGSLCLKGFLARRSLFPAKELLCMARLVLAFWLLTLSLGGTFFPISLLPP